MITNYYEKWHSTPIPNIPGIEGCFERPIHECEEELRSITEIAGKQLHIFPAYYLKGYVHALKDCYARESILRLLLRIVELLPTSNGVLLFDSWRPTLLQQELFDQLSERIKKAHPEYTVEQLIFETKRYVSLPSTDPRSPSPHLTGGAVDLTLCDQAGRELEMGTEFDHFGAQSRTRFYEEKRERGERLSFIEETSLRNRRILFHVMDHVGFTNYHEEWWHYDYGNQFWAVIKNCNASYGPKHLVED